MSVYHVHTVRVFVYGRMSPRVPQFMVGLCLYVSACMSLGLKALV